MHFTPTSSSWLNQVERWFGLLTDKQIRRGVHRNVQAIKAKQDPKVVKAFAAWSKYMKESGYSYKEPLDTSDDPKFGSPDVTPDEIATATTDISCRQKTDVARIWFEAEVELQKQAIEQHGEQLQTDRKALDAAVRKAAKVVTDAG